MNRNYLKFVPMALALAMAAGCASTNQPQQNDKVQAAQQSADEAKQTAAKALDTANQALQTANEAKAEAEKANARIDRAFKKSMNK